MQFGIRETTLLIKLAVVLALTVVVPGVFANWADGYRQEAVNRGQSLQTALREVRENLADVIQQKELYDNFQDSYELWQSRGVVTDTVDSASWRNVMYEIKQKRKLGVVDFSFGDSLLVASADSTFTADSTARIGVLPMNLSMPMLHDMDIFMFLDDLAKRADGMFIPLLCEMTRLEVDFDAVLRDNIRGTCEIIWIFADEGTV